MIRLGDKTAPLLRYLWYSILVTVLDVIIVWILYRPLHINIVISNTAGVIAGFLVHYLLASKTVFELEYGVIGFIIYLGTFLFGLALANGLIFVGERYLFRTMSIDMNFLFSKGLSISVPFFALYYLRKFLYGFLKKTRGEDKVYGKH